MLNKAFNISFNNDEKEKEKDFYPKDYQIDTSLDKDILDFFTSQKKEEDTYYLSKKTKNKKEKEEKEEKEEVEEIEDKEELDEYIHNFTNTNEIENEEEEDESSSSSELIYSTFPNNIETTKNNIYKEMNIYPNLIKPVIEEFLKTKDKFLTEFNKMPQKKEFDDNNKFIFNAKEFNNQYDLPKDDIINGNILPFISNGYLITNINKCFKALKKCNQSSKKEISILSEWFYTFLLFMEMPLSPDHSADLYSINKYIFNNFLKNTELKIIFIIISEIFKQILIL